MRRYLQDTNILSNLVRHPQGRIVACIAQVGEQSVCTSMVVASELRFGAAKRNASKLTTQVEATWDMTLGDCERLLLGWV